MEDYDAKMEEIQDLFADQQDTFNPSKVRSSEEVVNQNTSTQSVRSSTPSLVRQGVKLPEFHIEKFSGKILK